MKLIKEITKHSILIIIDDGGEQIVFHQHEIPVLITKLQEIIKYEKATTTDIGF